MIEYHPMAEVKGKERDIFGNKLWTYDSVLTLEKAYYTFFVWANSGYRIKKAWIEVYEDGRKADDIIYYQE